MKCIDNLKLFLLKYKNDKCDSLEVNFDKNLVRLLKEVKYFLQYGLEVSKNAQEI